MQTVIKKSSFNYKKFQKAVKNKAERTPFKEVAERTGLDRRLISKLVKDDLENPDSMQLCKLISLCDWMEVKVHEFFN